MKRAIPIVFIIAAIVFCVLGIQQLNESQTSLKVGEIELSAEDNTKKNVAYVYFGLSAIGLASGILMLNRKRRSS